MFVRSQFATSRNIIAFVQLAAGHAPCTARSVRSLPFELLILFGAQSPQCSSPSSHSPASAAHPCRCRLRVCAPGLLIQRPRIRDLLGVSAYVVPRRPVGSEPHGLETAPVRTASTVPPTPAMISLSIMATAAAGGAAAPAAAGLSSLSSK